MNKSNTHELLVSDPGTSDSQWMSRIRLLSKELVFNKEDGRKSYKDFISKSKNLKVSSDFKLSDPQIKLDWLPYGSFWLQVKFTLATPYFSKDDTPFYIIDNPLKKEKVFGVPYIAASSWKGNLRWTTMLTRLVLQQDVLSSDKFADERLQQTILFGTEQGFDETRTAGFAAYLDKLTPQAGEDPTSYHTKLKERFGTEEVPLPRLSGQLHFFPTYMDKIGLTVINPHDRTTRAGINPIYYEVATPGAKGVFHLLYVPRVGPAEPPALTETHQILTDLVPCIRDMFLTYGFSAKKTTGMGQAEAKSIEGFVQVAGLDLPDPAPPKPVEKPKKAAPKNIKGSFADLDKYDLSKVIVSEEVLETKVAPPPIRNKIQYTDFEDLIAKLEAYKASFTQQ